MFAALNQVAPLLAVGHPFHTATAGEPGVWVGGLLAGRDAVLLVAVNEDFAYSHEYSWQRPRPNVSLSFSLPWFRAARAVRLDGHEQTELPVSVAAGGQTTVTLSELVAAEVVLISADPELPGRLLAARRHERGYGKAEQSWRLRQDEWSEMLAAGHTAAILRDLELNRTGNLIEAQPADAAAVYRHAEGWANPTGETDNVLAWTMPLAGRGDHDARMTGARIRFTPRRAGLATLAFEQLVRTGQRFLYSLHDAAGTEIPGAVTPQPLNDRWMALAVTVPGAGPCEVRITEQGAYASQAWISRRVYVLPGMSLEQLQRNEPAPPEFALWPVIAARVRPDPEAVAAANGLFAKVVSSSE